MRLMPNIKLTEEDFRRILTRHKICSGGEATVCYGSNYGTVYKLFEENGNPEPMGDNKEKKVIELYQKQVKYSTIPVSTISVGDMVVGYEMITDEDMMAYEWYKLTVDQLLFILRKSKDVLNYFLSKGIIYCDVALRNILFNPKTGEIMFCDMDNTQIGNLEVDLMPFGLVEYEKVRGIDEQATVFAHNLMTLESYGIDYLCRRDCEIRHLFKWPVKRIMKSMVNPKKFNGEYVIDYKKECK